MPYSSPALSCVVSQCPWTQHRLSPWTRLCARTELHEPRWLAAWAPRGASYKSREPTERRARLCPASGPVRFGSVLQKEPRDQRRPPGLWFCRHEPTTMSRTDEVHRITENVYKVSHLPPDRTGAPNLWKPNRTRSGSVRLKLHINEEQVPEQRQNFVPLKGPARFDANRTCSRKSGLTWPDL